MAAPVCVVGILVSSLVCVSKNWIKMVDFREGETFVSYEELKQKKVDFEHANSIVLTVAESRKIETMRNRGVPNKTMSDALVYYQIDYCCKHGGKDYTERRTKVYS